MTAWSAWDDVVRLVRVAAEACGDDPSEYDGHSVRRGGATALFNAGIEFPRIMRFGRWHSDAVHAYLWEQRELQRDLAARMVAGARPPAPLADQAGHPALPSQTCVTSSEAPMCLRGGPPRYVLRYRDRPGLQW